jgi:hypothetical protein
VIQTAINLADSFDDNAVQAKAMRRSDAGGVECTGNCPYPTAIRFVRKMRGGTQAHLLQADDNQFYVVKFKNNPHGIRSLVNEWIVSGVMMHLGISTPATQAVRVPEQFLDQNPEVHLQRAAKMVLVAPGLHFGSQYPGDPDRSVVHDLMPRPLLRDKTVNVSDFVGTLVIDKWTANTDARQAVFTRTGGTGYAVHMIDHGAAFDGQNWSFFDAPLLGLYRDPAAYETVRGWGEFEPWLERVADFPAEVIWRRLASIPKEWIAHEGDEPERLVRRLLRRRKRVAGLIESMLGTGVVVFPNWGRLPLVPVCRIS